MAHTRRLRDVLADNGVLKPSTQSLVLGASATEAGALLTPGIVLSPITAFFAGLILSRTGRYRPICRVGAVVQNAPGGPEPVLLPASTTRT